MINVKKGPAHSLGQADVRGNWDGSTDFVAGQVAYIDNAGVVKKGYPVGTTTAAGIAGFVIDGPVSASAPKAGQNFAVNESGKIALYTLDGTSVIETDQFVGATSLYKIGIPVYAVAAGSTEATAATRIGLITTVATEAAASGAVPIGWVEGVRTLQKDGNTAFTSQDYTSYDSQGNTSTKAYVYRGQANVSLVAIKLAATSVGAGAIVS